MRNVFLIWIISGCLLSCGRSLNDVEGSGFSEGISQLLLPQSDYKALRAESVSLEKDFLYDKYTLSDKYPYEDTVRSFKWMPVRKCLAFIENMQWDETVQWAFLSNYKNQNGEADLVRSFMRNEYNRVSDTLGIERYQSVPLFLHSDTLVPVRYGRDGSLVRVLSERGGFYSVALSTAPGKWVVPKKYVKKLAVGVKFNHVIVIDRADQNIATLERIAEGKWVVRSMNPATTGVHKPPYAQETPLGMFLLQQKKEKMVFLKDGGTHIGGYAPYASRFTNGAYIHGVPVNVPQTEMIEYSWSLGTVPRSHMCVRVATSHAKFIYDWAPVRKTLIIVIG